ncbi:MAG: hypothetical protein QM778_25910 [Myxococcales bacterium]
MRTIDSPDEVLGRMLECLVIAFSYSVEAKRFVLVSDYPDKSPGSVRELIALVFHDVDRFFREPGDLPALARFHFSYFARDEVGGRVVQSVQSTDVAPGLRRARFWFGPNFGGVTLDYRSLAGLARGSRVVQKGREFVYSDVQTSLEFDFYNPFPDLLNP